MPLIGFACKCGLKVSRMISPADLSDLQPKMKCPGCNQDTMVRQLGKTNSTSKIKVDNGLQGKTVEIYPEVIDARYGKNQSS